MKLSSESVVNLFIVVGMIRACGQGPAGHQDDFGAGCLDDFTLFQIGGHDS